MPSDLDLKAYREDGVVALRGAIPETWLKTAARGIARNIESPGRFFRDQTPEGSPARYVFDFWTWREIPEFEELIYGSPAAALACGLLESLAVTMIMDNWFLREAGSTGSAPWHHDEPYFDFEGRMCNIWIPLEPVPADEGLEFVCGSHRWGKVFAPFHFKTHETFAGVGADYPPMPDIESARSDYDFMTFDLEPGDCLVFDLRTLHRGKAATHPLPQTNRRLSLRFAAEGARFQPRGPWTEEITDYLVSLGQTVGSELDCPLLPRLSA